VKLLLDTHTLLWWDEDELPKAVTKRIQRADEVFVSAASAWEIEIKAELGTIEARGELEKLVADYGFLELPVTIRHTRALRGLPSHHRDPFDRLLIAQALADDLVLVTSDETIARYTVPIVWE
jgi:PIN domain nuclease of toxin-antitoxin system